MVSDTRSARNSKDEGHVRSSKKKTDNRKDSSRHSPGKDQASGVRRSPRETSESIQKTPSPHSKRKSKRLEKGPPPLSPTMKRKSERLEKHITPSPVRRSDRGKKVFSPSSSGSKKSAKELSLSEWKRTKEKNVIQVTMESEKAELDREAVGMKRKNMNARSFMALFKRQRVKIVPDGAVVLEGQNKVSDVCSDNSRGIASEPINGEGISDECSRRMVGELRDGSIGIDKASDGAHQKSNYSSKECHEGMENNVNVEFSRKDNCSSTENMDALESESSTCLAKTGDGSVCSDVGEKCVRSKVTGATLSPSPKCESRDLLGTCVLCSKNKRVVYNSWEQELCSCSFTVDEDHGSFSTCKGRSVHEAAVTSETAEKCDSRHLLAEMRADSQMGGHENVCALCNKSGELLCCEGKGCKRFYHLCCLDPPQTDAFPGVWHCPHCVKKKLLFGVHSVSEGVESIWDVREVEVSNVKGVRQRQYLVKYKGLAHIHNHWLPEKQLLLEKSCLVSNFIEKDQIVRWSAEWTVPHRLLRKRSIQDNIYIASSSVISVCNYEWLVKWHGLGYDHATWELDNADCLSSPLGQNLMKDYETRCERAKQEANLHHKGSIVKLSELPASQSLVNDKYVLKNVNKLRECVFKCQNAVVFDDQERATTIMFFLRSISEICRPFLIVTASSSLSQWEAEFARLVPSVDVVVYSGNKDTRKGIRASEFYDEGGHLMLQVLLSSVEAVFEDLDRLISIKWEAVVVDDYQQFGISHDHEQIKMLPTDARILLVSGQIKDSSSEYLKMLSLLESHGDLDKWKGLKSDTNDHLCRLKDRFSRFIAYGSNSQLSKFLEYWVPVHISNYQLEHYCATLLDNSVHLCSCSRTDRVGALRDILLTVRKCCDHPYLLDSSVQGRMFAEKRPVAEILEFGIKASGKLELLDTMLTEINTRGLQVLVLYQLISGLEKASIGHILDDFLRQRFGQNSYERVEYSAFPSKKQAAEKQAAVDRFNKKETGQFIFLLENRACSSTIKLSSLDVIVIYDSDWNPANDLRTLQKLSIGSEVEQIKVFRLYSSFTVEERALVLAKQNLNLDNNLQNSSRTARTTSDTLSWGATYLFSKLDECHADGTSSSALNFSSGQLRLSEVTKEFQAILSGNTDSNSVISKVKLGIGSYSTDVPMLGEANVQLKDGEEPHVFWRHLLQGKNSIWKNLNGPSPRNRKRIHYFEGSPSKVTEGDDVAKKRKKMVDDSLDPALVQVDLGVDQVSRVAVSNEEPSIIKACNRSENLQKDGTSKNNLSGMSGHNSYGTGVSEGMSEERIISSDERKKLHKSLEAEMMRLCQVIKFSEDVTDIVLRFLEYVIKHRDVNSDSQSVVQALQISLCWIAASITKTKIDKKDSLMSAKQLLNYQCTEEQAHSVYLILKEMYLQCPEKIVNSGRYCSLAEEGITKEKTTASDRDNNIKKLQKKFKKRMKRLLQKHKEQLQDLHLKWDKERIKLETDHKLESVFIRSAYGQSPVGMDKLKLLDNDSAAKMEELNLEKDMELKSLEAKQLSDIDEEKRKTAQWLALAKANQSGAVNEPPQSLGPQSEKHVVESPQPSAPPADEAIGCETRVENWVTVISRNEVGVSSSAVIEHVNQSKHSGDNEETVPANPVEERNSSEKMSDKGCKSPSPDAWVNERCEPNEAAASGDLQSPGQQQPSVHSEQTTAVPDRSDLSPQQVQQDKTDQSLAPAKPPDLDQRALENQSTLEIETELINTVNPVPSDHEAAVTNQTVSPVSLTHEAPVTGETVNPVPSNHAAPVIENSLLSCNKSPAIERNDQGRSSSPQTAEPSGTEVLSHESVPQSGENSDIHNNHVNTGPVCSVANGQSVELSGVSQNDVSTLQVVASTTELPNQAVLPLRIDAGHVEGPSYLLHPTHRPASGSLHLSLLADPLQKELENLHRESEQLEKYHKDMVSKLKSDCEKEIQEIITQIRNKYEGKLQESEAEFILKKNELDKNQNKVFMNKILAAAFRHKCSTPRPAPGVPSSFVQHMHQLSMPPSTRPPSCHSAPAQPIASPSLQTGQQLSRSHPARSPPVVNQNVASPPIQAVQNAAALFSSTPPSRPPPLISTITPSCNSRQVGEIRSAAPHLQSFRPSVAVSAPCSTSPSAPQLRPMLQRLPSQPLQAPPPRGLPPPAPPLPSFTNLVVSQNRARPNNPSPSAPGLVVENDRRPKNNRTSDLPEICSTFGSLELCDLEILGNIGGNQASCVGTDVVCLSDDD